MPTSSRPGCSARRWTSWPAWLGSGAALEFAIGTGRVGIPLAARGVPVTGIELSEAMLAQLRRKADEAALPVLVGDMATTRAPGTFSLVYLVFNTISNLRTQQEQVECFRNAARHLSPGGRFVIELWVPAIRRMPPGQNVVPMSLAEGHLDRSTPTTSPPSSAARTTTSGMPTGARGTAPATSATSGPPNAI